MERAYYFWYGLDQHAIEESFAPSLGHLMGTGQDCYPLRTRPIDGNIRQTGDTEPPFYIHSPGTSVSWLSTPVGGNDRL